MSVFRGYCIDESSTSCDGGASHDAPVVARRQGQEASIGQRKGKMRTTDGHGQNDFAPQTIGQHYGRA